MQKWPLLVFGFAGGPVAASAPTANSALRGLFTLSPLQAYSSVPVSNMNSGLGTMNSMNTYMTMNTMSTSGNMTPASFNMSYANPGLGAGLSPGAVAGMPGGSAGAMNSRTAGVTAMGTTLSPGGMGAMGAQPAASMNVLIWSQGL